MSDVQLSAEAHQRLTDELEDLTTRGRVEVAQRIEAARALGDLKENGDYHAAKDDQGKMESRIRQIEAMLKNATIVDTSISSNTVVPGSVIRIRYEDDDEVARYPYGSIEEKREGLEILSPNSPLGLEIKGKQAGDKAAYQLPNGTSMTVEIVEVGS